MALGVGEEAPEPPGDDVFAQWWVNQLSEFGQRCVRMVQPETPGGKLGRWRAVAHHVKRRTNLRGLFSCGR